MPPAANQRLELSFGYIWTSASSNSVLRRQKSRQQQDGKTQNTQYATGENGIYATRRTFALELELSMCTRSSRRYLWLVTFPHGQTPLLPSRDHVVEMAAAAAATSWSGSWPTGESQRGGRWQL